MVLRAVRTGSIALALWVFGALPASAWCVRGVDSWDTLRIRTAPSPQAREVGAIPANACGVVLYGGCRGSWCPVAFRGRSGWSNATYLTGGNMFAGTAMPSWRMLLPPPPPPRMVAAPPSPPRRASAAVRRAPPKRVASVPARPAAQTRPPVVRDVTPPEARIAAPIPPPPAAPPAAPPQVQPARPPLPATPRAAPTTPPTAGAALVVPPAAAAPAAAGAEVCVIDVAKGDTLKVRAGPGSDQTLRFGYPAGACGVKITGPCKDGWCPVDYRGYRGWAEQKFLK